MANLEKLNIVKGELRQAMMQSIFEPLVRNCVAQLERSFINKDTFKHDDHVWTVDRYASIWTIKCAGLYDWKVQFDEGWFKGPAGDDYLSIDTFIFEPCPLADTATHLKMAITFVSNFIANTQSDMDDSNESDSL